MNENKSALTNDPMINALLRKATSPSDSQRRGERPSGGVTPTRSEMMGMVSSRIRTIKNAERIYDALPEMETIVTIAVSSLLSSKDLTSTTLIYDNVADIPIDLRAELLDPVRTYHNDVRKLPKKLYQWLYDAMKSKGASPVMLISDSGFDKLFGLKTTVAQESVRRFAQNNFTRQLGILGTIGESNKVKVGLESILNRTIAPLEPQKLSLNFNKLFADDRASFDLTVTDNPGILKLPEFYRKVARENARSGLYGQLEQAAYNQPSTPQGASAYDPNPVDWRQEEAKKLGMIDVGDLNPGYDKRPETELYAEVPKIEFNEHNEGEYTERTVPAEACAPVIIGDDVRNPLGWLVILDELGNYINARSTLYGDATFMNYLNNDGMIDSVINRSSLGLGESMITPEIAQRISSRYGELAEDQLARQLSPALGGAELSINITEPFVRVMMVRQLAKRHTQVLYVPAENMCYFATDFNEDGIGVSITERSFVISTVRMALLFATMNSSILNSARHMQYDIELSPDDRNGQETVDRLKADIINSYNRKMPLWGNMDDVYSMATNAGLAFNVTGNEFYASTKVSVSDNTPDYKVPDKELDDGLLRRTCHIAGVDPELALTPENIEFASQIFSKSLLVTQQNTKKQEILAEPLTRYVTCSLMASPKLQSNLLKIISDYVRRSNPNLPTDEFTKLLSEYLAKFINGMRVTLPPPDTSAGNSQMDLFDKRMEFFEKLADLVVTEDIGNLLQNEGLSDISPDDLKTMLKSYYARSWLRKQGIENEFFDMVYDSKKRSETVQSVAQEVTDASTMLIQLAKRVKGRVGTVASNADLEASDAAGAAAGGFGADDNAGADDSFGDDGFGDGDDLDSLGEEGSDADATDAGADDTAADAGADDATAEEGGDENTDKDMI